MKDFNLKWLSIFGGLLAAMICNACDVGFFATLNIGIPAGLFLYNLCEFYSPAPINITVKIEKEK